MITRRYFIECSGNSLGTTLPKPVQMPAGAIHGMISCSEWTGVPLRVLLEEAGLQPNAKWLLAEGADSAHMSRSIPLEKALDDAMIALFQNGERLRREQGYPLRLLLSGWVGNTNVKWLRRLKVTEGPTHTRDETSKYADLLPDGRALQFTFEIGVKSVIAKPSSMMTLPGPGFYEISCLAWSGAGRITRVEVSVDGGATWLDAVLTGEKNTKCLGALSTAMGMDWASGRLAKPRHGRERPRTAYAHGVDRALCARQYLSSQRHRQLGGEQSGKRDSCLRLGARNLPAWS